MPNALIIEQYEGQPVHFMGDGWFNATGPAKRHGKEPYEWLRLPDTEAYLAALGRRYASNAQEMSKPGKSRFVLTRRGGRPGEAGTWLHPKLAVRFAQWLDVDFAIWCDEQIDKIIRGATAQPDPNALSTVADREPLYLLAIQIMVKHGLSLPVIYRALAHFAGVESFKAMLRGHIAQAGGFGGAILAGTDSGAQWRQLESNRIAITGHPSQSKLDLGPLVLGSYRAREVMHA
ncbi:KilA-N domain-containing protein [Achromobacter xylosoxidans]|uniref:KilA-N domain-containing protein n=1 Tax=Alcaligenes xylosoxydans xylosoxydans TaxID=85698 RepID=UPI002A74E54C|nr:KilA-N domain-containing protein [Achromobacter xylosoxidans]WPQ37776.1 KilA-N domain-containing protein [Achromobacter xylosoxidans]